MSRDSEFLNALQNLTEVKDPVFRDAFRRAMEVSGGEAGIPEADLSAEVLRRQNQTARESGAGKVSLRADGAVQLSSGLTIDIGAGVGLDGNGGWISTITTSGGVETQLLAASEYAITLQAASPASPAVPGVDVSSNQVHGQRARIQDFSLVMPSRDTATCNGILISSDHGSTQNPRPVIEGVNIRGGNYQLTLADRCYCARIGHGTQENGVVAMRVQWGDDSGENCSVHDRIFSNSDTLLQVDSGTNGGTVSFFACSFDYPTPKVVDFVSGYGWFNFAACHVETGFTDAEAPIDLSVTAHDWTYWTFNDTLFLHRAGVARNYPAYFSVGSKHDVRLVNPSLQSIVGVGVQITADEGPGGTPTYESVLAEVTGTGRFTVRGIREFNTPANLPRLPTGLAKYNWLRDGDFAQSSLLDPWYVSGGFGTPARDTVNGHGSAGCLKTTLSGGASVARSLKVLVRVKGEVFSLSLWAKLTGGSGTLEVRYREAIHSQEPNPSSTPASAPTIESLGSFVTVHSAALATTGWTNLGTTGNSPRHRINTGTTHIELYINGFSLNADTFDLLIDRIRVESW